MEYRIIWSLDAPYLLKSLPSYVTVSLLSSEDGSFIYAKDEDGKEWKLNKLFIVAMEAVTDVSNIPVVTDGSVDHNEDK